MICFNYRIDLTQKYYSHQIFREAKYYYIKYQYQKFNEKKIISQILEEEITLVIQWLDIESKISYPSIKISLDRISDKILKNFKQKYPHNSYDSLHSTILIILWLNLAESFIVQIIDRISGYRKRSQLDSR